MTLLKKVKVNNEGRDFVVGDLHGHYEMLQKFLSYIDFDFAKDRLFSVGDLVDRGPSNEECLDLLYQDWFHCVAGNHELMALEWYDGKPGLEMWYRNGGMWAQAHEKISCTDESIHVRDTINERVRHLPAVMTVELKNNKKFHIIHAELMCDYPLTDSMLEDESVLENILCKMAPENSVYIDGPAIFWGRKIFLRPCLTVMDDRAVSKYKKEAALDKFGAFFTDELSPIYSGHSVVRQPTRFGGQTNLDTGCFLIRKTTSSGRDVNPWAGLTFTEPETDLFWTVKPDGVHIATVQDLSI
jgi:hypothetical protein